VIFDNLFIFVKNKYYDKRNTLDISVNNIISYIEDEEKIILMTTLLKTVSRRYIHGISDLFVKIKYIL
jgi:hypothetical protein